MNNFSFNPRAIKGLLFLSILGGLGASQTYADDGADLAQQLSNPVANLVSVPFQLNYDENIGMAKNIERYQLNIQPVIPIELNENWNLISRTVLPLNYQIYNQGGVMMIGAWVTLYKAYSFLPQKYRTVGLHGV